MSAKTDGSRRRQFKAEEATLRSIIAEWDPIPDMPNDEYDTLVHRLLSTLHRGASQKEVLGVIAEYFDTDFGVPMPRDDIANITEKVWTWWQSQESVSSIPEGRDV